VWYAFTPTADVSVLIETLGSDYNTTLSVYTDVFTGSKSTPLLVDCAYNPFPSQRSALAFQALAGKTYFIQVGSLGPALGGNLTFNATEFPISARIDPHVTFDPETGIGTVATTVTCTAPEFITAVATGIELLTDGTIGPSATEVARPLVTCDPDHPLSLTQQIFVISERGNRRGGPAIVDSTIVKLTGERFITFRTRTTVTLTGH
jgi:hypothetical protein